MGAGAFWNVGWGLHLLHDQHFWSSSFPEDGMACGEHMLTWLNGNTGIVMGMFLVSFVILVALVTVLSGIGVCEKCTIGSGGVYSMISTVLGGQVGGTIGLLYIFG
ncbi:Solute carrier family 12 member 8, partial [Lonchura striata]